ncbi:hypothetical protein ANHYDRO_01091 [Anaerococcus hydrogenalis DSM 7454]|uniref:Uncharacterized protein n=1 Tax=Anaerococcus hydrogenalis DSM 7454 TaxID=561177 RepID=B6W940_9FIRM|nr:hypothetical protein ANHYDRO_01091 [Anaerococcus hydrogenalis DSM 7454]
MILDFSCFCIFLYLLFLMLFVVLIFSYARKFFSILYSSNSVAIFFHFVIEYY